MTKLIEQARKRFKVAVEAESRQRKREEEDLRFQVPENQWSDAARRERSGNQGDALALDARPMISIPKLDQPVRLVMNQARAAHLGVNIHPVSEDADREQAEMRQGLYRCIERESHAQVARLWALDRAVKAGTGFYRINTQWEQTTPDLVRDKLPVEYFDQKITIELIFWQDTVYFDPAAEHPNRTDAEWCFVTSWVPVDTFRRRYGKAKLARASDEDLSAMAKAEDVDEPRWVMVDGERQALRVAEYFSKVHEQREIALLSTGQIVLADRVPNGVEVLKQREVDVVSLMRYEMSGNEVLLEDEWNGAKIPIVTVIGNELQPFDGEKRRVGIIGPAKDSQRLFNWAASIAIEKAALEPKAPWLVAEDQIGDYADMWKQANRRNFPALIYKPSTFGGTLVPPPQRVQVDVSQLGPSMALLQQADDFIQGATAVFDPALGNLSPKERSGKAIQALQGQADASNSHYVSNLALAMEYEAEVVLDMMPRIYDRPGRVAYILDGEDNEKAVMLNAPYVVDQQKRPQRVPQAGMDGAPAGIPKGAKTFMLGKGRYGYSVSIGRSYQTRLQEGQQVLGDLYGTLQPDLQLLLLPLVLKFMDAPGMHEASELVKEYRAQKFQGIGEDDQTDEQKLKQQAMKLEQENKELKGMLAQAAQAIETEAEKQKATLEKAGMDAESKELAEATKIAVEEIRAEAKLKEQEMEAKLALLLQTMKQTHERALADQKADHERRMGSAAAGVSESEGQKGREFQESESERQSEEAERGREFEGEQAEADRLAAERAAEREPEE